MLWTSYGSDEVSRADARALRHDRVRGSPTSFELDTNNTLVGFASTDDGNSFGAVAGAIALISLVVGGIVIMNIMLVSA